MADQRAETITQPNTKLRRLGTLGGAASGVWLNTRAVSSIDIPFKHELTPINDGWRITASVNGKLTIHFTDGKQQKYDLIAGDTLSASGEQMYIVLSNPQ